MKDEEVIRRVVLDCKKRQVIESLKLLRIAKLQGRIERLGGEVISDDEFESALKDFGLKFSKKKQESRASMLPSIRLLCQLRQVDKSRSRLSSSTSLVDPVVP